MCRDSQLSQVLERGSGSAAALAILYMEVCERVGLPMGARLLDGGRYVVLWPTGAPLRTCGQHFVVDAYSQGELFLLDEVSRGGQPSRVPMQKCRIFSGAENLIPCSSRGIPDTNVSARKISHLTSGGKTRRESDASMRGWEGLCAEC